MKLRGISVAELVHRAAENDLAAWARLLVLLDDLGPSVAARTLRSRALGVATWRAVRAELAVAGPGPGLLAAFSGADSTALEHALAARIGAARLEHERALFERVLAKDVPARNELFESYRDPLLEVWSTRGRRSSARTTVGLDEDFVHWFLMEWLARPEGEYGNLRKLLPKEGRRPLFLSWFAVQARSRYADFIRETVEAKHHAQHLDALAVVAELERPVLAAPSDPEARVAREQALEHLRGCLERFTRQGTGRLSRLFAKVLGVLPPRPIDQVVRLLEGLGVVFEDGEPVPRRGRVSQELLSSAREIGTCLEAHGHDRADVALALPELLETLRRELESPGAEG